MMFLVVLESCLLLISIFFVVLSWKNAKKDYYRRQVTPSTKTEKEGALSKFFSFRNIKMQMYSVVTTGGVVGGILAALNGGSFVFAGSIIAFLIWGIYRYQEGSYEIKYRKNGKISVEYLSGILSAGGTLEDWVGEVRPKLSGSLAAEFEVGYANYQKNIPITTFLERLIKNCPDSSLGLIWSGLLREIRQAGDMKTFVEEALKDLQNQERINRVMGKIRKNGAQMMAWVCVLPGTLYALFSDVLKEILNKHPYTNIVLFGFLAGYGLILWWGMRISQGAQKKA